MKKVLIMLTILILASCSKKDDDVEMVPLRDYAAQYKADNDSIIKYLKTHYIKEVTSNFDVEIDQILTDGTQVSIWDQKVYPLESRDVYNRDVNYKVYYLTLRKGTGLSPCNTDNIFAAYSGNLLDGTVFSSSYGIGGIHPLYFYVTKPEVDGWSEIFPQFKTGTSRMASNGVIAYDDFGAGVMFLPSGLGYYANTTAIIPAYSPLVYSFKLFDLERLDHDLENINGKLVNVPDGVPDYLEDVNHDGYVYDLRDKIRYPNLPVSLIDDTDGDGFADFLDFDDDGDGYTTRFEITKPNYDLDPTVSGISKYYPFDKIDDDPKTLNVDETERHGIPAFSASGTPDYLSPTRLRIHVDKDHHSGKP